MPLECPIFNPCPKLIDLLKSRRSVKPIELNGPGPTPAELSMLLTIASRVPDHGKLTPWRFIVFEGEAGLKAGESIAAVFREQAPGRHARPNRARAKASRPRAAGDRRGQPRRPARENPGMGAGALGRRRRNQPGVCSLRARLRRKLAHRMVRLRPPCARRARGKAGREDRGFRPYRPAGEADRGPAAAAA